ncbi:hypothetical protein V2J09_020410, partial [Rumex salicifolius]
EYGKRPSDFYLRYVYEKSFHGCVAKLTDFEAKQSWDFIGFSVGAPRTTVESDIIIGVIDSGITPESESFNDTDFGARFYRADGEYPEKEGPTARDFTGHGTHSASTAAGDLVPMASLSGLASGTARGGVPSARIAVYKVSWTDGVCSAADILAAFDDAISDGVDIISASVGSPRALPYFEDPIAIGSFHANRRGILSSTSAGNDGPSLGTVSNVAPWLLSVAASTIDRKIVTEVELGNGKVLQGISINTFDLQKKKFPLIYAGDACSSSSNPTQARFCAKGSLNPKLVKGKIVLCDIEEDKSRAMTVLENQVNATEGSLAAGAVGTLMYGSIINDFTQSFRLPASFLDVNDGAAVRSYIRKSISYYPIGSILKSHDAKDTLAPYIASFSSRGPNPISPGILKPDLAAPGVEILAAWSPCASQSEIPGDERQVYFNIMSGTSMACPHASAAAAYVKSFHPDWSPSAIKSALMFTASPLTKNINPEGGLAYGAGHIDPFRAANSGLIFDITDDDYINFLCSQGIPLKQIQGITNCSVTCPDHLKSFDLNYPAIMIATKSKNFSQTFTRTVTNVRTGDDATCDFTITAKAAKGISIEVTPSVLSFECTGQTQTFTVKVSSTTSFSANAVNSGPKLDTSTLEFTDGINKGSMKIQKQDG